MPSITTLAVLAFVVLTAACSASDRGDDIPQPPDASPSMGPSVSFVEPVAVHEYRGGIPVEIIVNSPLAALHEAGLEIAGERRVICGDWPVVVGLHCGVDLSVWELNLAAGLHPVRAFVTDVEGRTATADLTLTVRPYVRPIWEFTGELIINPPVIAGNIVLAPSDQLYALDRDDGTLLWSYDAAHGGPFDRIEGVIADDERAYAVKDWDRDVLVALDLATGAVVWEVDLEDPVYSSPVWDGEGHIVVGDSESELRAFRRDGTEAWKVDVDPEDHGAHIPALQPVVAPDGTIYALPVNRDRIVHVSAAGDVLDTITTAHDWHSALSVAPDGTIYASDDEGLRAYSPAGELLRFLPTSGSVVEPVRFGSGGSVYVAVEFGGVFVLDAAGSTLWERPMPELIRGTPFEAPDGSLFIGALGYGFAYQVDAAGHPLEEIPYCNEPYGFVADSDLLVCTTVGTVYAVSLDSLRPDGDVP